MNASWTTQLLSALTWYGVIAVMGAIAFPWLALFFRRLPDRGYGASRTAGLLTVAYGSWWVAAAGGRFCVETLWALVGVGVVASTMLVALNVRVRTEMLRVLKTHGWRIELAILGLFVFAAILRAFQPEIFWGEKPMDFTFYNYFGRLELLPPEDPWASDQPMRYYYMGNWLFAVLHKMTGVMPGIGYNLALISIPTLTFGGLLSATLPLVRKMRWAFAGSLLPVFLANTEAVRMLVTGDPRAINFDFFWATSRVLKHSMANEYPFWSYLFGDLHAHVIAVPCAALLLALFVGLLAQKKRPPTWRGFAMRVVVGGAWGALFPVNGWDAIAYGVIIPFTLALRAPARLFRDVPRLALGRRLIDGGIMGFSAIAVAYPFWESILPVQGSLGHGWTWNEFHSFESLWRADGGLWFPLLALALAFTLRGARGTHRTRTFGWESFAERSPRTLPQTWDDWMRWLPIVVLLAFAVVPKVDARPWETLLTAGIVFAIAWALRFGHGQGGNRRIIGSLLGGAAMLFLFTESYWIVDRMNSLFKLHYALWFLCAFLVGASLPALFITVRMAAREAWDRRVPVARRAVLGLAALMIVIPIGSGLVGSGIAALVMTTFQRTNGPRPTLDGTAYLQRTSPNEAAVIGWMRTNVDPRSVILEAQGDSYREYTRISMHTGLPTVLGWEHHVKQRSTPPQEVDKRKKDIETMYTTNDETERLKLLDQYGVRFIIVSNIERQRYGAEKFGAWDRLRTQKKGRIRPVFESLDVVIYSVAKENTDRTLTAHE